MAQNQTPIRLLTITLVILVGLFVVVILIDAALPHRINAAAYAVFGALIGPLIAAIVSLRKNGGDK